MTQQRIEYYNADMAASNGAGKMGELGSTGLEVWSGFINKAYHADLTWPAVYTLYNRLRRSDPEIGGIIRPAFVNMARQLEVRVESPIDEPEDVDSRAVEFLKEVLDDIDGGIVGMLEDWVSYVPFMGWGWWEELLAMRRLDWSPPGEDDWRSKYDDGLIGIRRFAHRDHSSFVKWDMDDASGNVRGMEQMDVPNPAVVIPIERALHLTFGDSSNPEGLSPLEAVWRVERRQRNYEIVHGIGSEHAAGHLKFRKEEGKLSTGDGSAISSMARSVMSAREGNYLAVPAGIEADIMDVTFSAASDIFEMIKYLGMVKLQIYQMQFVAIAVTSGLGSQTAIEDSRAQALLAFNGMMAGFMRQFNEQAVKRLFRHPVNAARFVGLEKLPVVNIVPLETPTPMSELSQFIAQIAPVMPLDDEDWKAVRGKSGFLPEELPLEDETDVPEPPQPFEDMPPDEEIERQAQEMIQYAIEHKPGFAELWNGGVDDGGEESKASQDTGRGVEG